MDFTIERFDNDKIPGIEDYGDHEITGIKKHEKDELINSPDMVKDAALLLSQQYGIWGPHHKRPGDRIKMTPKKLCRDCLASGQEDVSIVRAKAGEKYIGHAIACRWTSDVGRICWITQLVVEKESRSSGVATGLLEKLIDPDVYAYGILSSHPHAIMTLRNVFGGRVLDLKFLKDHAVEFMKASPIRYVKEAKLHGALFDSNEGGDAVSVANTEFAVCHLEPEKALQALKERGEHWVLGALPESHEYLLMVRNVQ